MPKLTSEQVSTYRKHGYLLIENFFENDVIDAASNSITRVLEDNELANVAELEPEDNSIARRIWSPTKKSSELNEIACGDALLDAVESLIGANIILQYSKLNMKQPKVGSVVEWHQDFSYYPHTNTDLLTAVIYLDDANEENGCLQVISQQDCCTLQDHYIDGYFRGKIDVKLLEDKQVHSLTAPRGSVIFLHCLTAHYSSPNRSELPRRAFLPAYRAADAFPIYYGPHAAHNEPNAQIVRGESSRIARTEEMNLIVPLSQKPFGSLFEIQEGSHLAREDDSVIDRGYYSS